MDTCKVSEDAEKHGSNACTIGCFTVAWWIGEADDSFIHIVAPVPFAKETRPDKFQPNPNMSRNLTLFITQGMERIA